MALAFVEGQVVDNAVGLATTPAFTNTFAVGQLVVVNICYDGGANATTLVADNATVPNTYTLIGAASVGNGTTMYQAVYSSVIATAKASPTVTVTYNSAATNADVVVQYFNGFVGTATLDQSKSQTNASSTTATSGASSATTQATELVVGVATHISTASAFTLGSGYTNLTTNNIANRAVAMESKVVGSTGAQTATFTIAAARVNTGGVITFYDTGGAAPAATISTLMMMGV